MIQNDYKCDQKANAKRKCDDDAIDCFAEYNVAPNGTIPCLPENITIDEENRKIVGATDDQLSLLRNQNTSAGWWTIFANIKLLWWKLDALLCAPEQNEADDPPDGPTEFGGSPPANEGEGVIVDPPLYEGSYTNNNPYPVIFFVTLSGSVGCRVDDISKVYDIANLQLELSHDEIRRSVVGVEGKGVMDRNGSGSETLSWKGTATSHKILQPGETTNYKARGVWGYQLNTVGHYATIEDITTSVARA